MAEFAVVNGLPASGFPSTDLPAIFFDNVSSFAVSSGTAKFFVNRVDPNFAGDGTFRSTTVAQMILPLANFIGMVRFFQDKVDSLVPAGILTQEQFDEIKSQFDEFRNASKPNTE